MARDFDALARYLAERQAAPFAWGRDANDCVSFAAGAVLAQTGVDPLKGLRWNSATTAARLIKKFGGLANAVGTRLEPVPPAQAHRGDIAGVPGDYAGGIALMVIDGPLLIGAGGTRLHRSAMTHAWSAG